jgi:hypothetical protein
MVALMDHELVMLTSHLSALDKQNIQHFILYEFGTTHDALLIGK